MFVPAPPLPGNGVVVEYQTLHKGDGGGVFYTIDDAASGPYGDAPLYNTAVKGYTVRQYCSSGIKPDGSFGPTRYFTKRGKVEIIRGLKWVVEIPNPGGVSTYRNRYREIGTGYIGGNETGVDWPETLLFQTDNTGFASAIANRAIGASLENRCLAEALNKARDQKFDLSESLVGLGQTFWMILERGSQLLLAYRQARRGQWQASLKTLGIWDKRRKWRLPSTKDAADFWLEIQFGWLPLMSDIHDGVNLINEGLGRPKSLFNVVRRLEQRLPFSEWTGTSEPYGWTKRTVKIDALASVEVRHRFRVSDPQLAALTSIGLDNPLYVLWVALPWSFVIDWLIPVGDWLRAVSSPLGLTYVDGYMSSRRAGVIDIHGEEFGAMHDPNFPTVWRSDKSAWTRVSAVELNRIPYADWPKPLPYARIPSMSTRRATNAVALLRQQLGKAPR